MSIFAELVQADKRTMSVENYFIYTCAWCCIQVGLMQPMQPDTMHSTEFSIACQGGIVFW